MPLLHDIKSSADMLDDEIEWNFTRLRAASHTWDDQVG
jgi:hypothetical protein